jgi:O-antigen/teichoic acid export membrane protein
VAVEAPRIPRALSWRRVRQASGRMSWGVADQAMSSLTNFLLAIFVARTLGAAEFGAFSLAYVTYGFAINASRGLSIEPLLIRFSGTDPLTWRRATAGSTGTALLVGLVIGACAFVVARIVGGTTGLAFVALGLTLPGLMLQDAWRYCFFALGRGQHAFVNDLIWAVLLLPSLALLKLSGHANVFWFVVAWGGAAAVAAAVAPLQAKVMPNLPGATKWLIRHRDLGPRYLAENTASNSADTLRSYTGSYILGLAAVGYIQAAGTLMGPFKIVFFGISLIAMPEAARILRRSPRHLPLFCAAASLGFMLLAVAWGAVLLVGLPRGLGHLMLGNLWRPTYPLVLPATLAIVSLCANTGAILGLHALGAARRSLRAVVLTSVIVVSCAVVGAVTHGVLGTMWFAAGASWVGTMVSWWQFRHALLESDTVPVPAWMWPGRSAGSPRALFQPRGLLDERRVDQFRPDPLPVNAAPPIAERLMQDRDLAARKRHDQAGPDTGSERIRSYRRREPGILVNLQGQDTSHPVERALSVEERPGVSVYPHRRGDLNHALARLPGNYVGAAAHGLRNVDGQCEQP